MPAARQVAAARIGPPGKHPRDRRPQLLVTLAHLSGFRKAGPRARQRVSRISLRGALVPSITWVGAAPGFREA